MGAKTIPFSSATAGHNQTYTQMFGDWPLRHLAHDVRSDFATFKNSSGVIEALSGAMSSETPDLAKVLGTFASDIEGLVNNIVSGLDNFFTALKVTEVDNDRASFINRSYVRFCKRPVEAFLDRFKEGLELPEDKGFANFVNVLKELEQSIENACKNYLELGQDFCNRLISDNVNDMQCEQATLEGIFTDLNKYWSSEVSENGAKLKVKLNPLIKLRSINIPLTILKRTLGNLIKNAYQEIRDNGSADNGSGKPEIIVAPTIVPHRTYDVLKITVSNPGEIPEANLKQVFDKGFTTKEKNGGTGIGLAASKEDAKRFFGGDLVAENTTIDGKPTVNFTLTVNLPKKPIKVAV